jgi:hypothetical protein
VFLGVPNNIDLPPKNSPEVSKDPMGFKSLSNSEISPDFKR